MERLERRLGAVLPPETDAETNRRMVLVKAAHVGHEPANLTADERLTFSKIQASIPIFQELLDEGIIDGHGQPSGGDDHPYDGHEDGDDPPYEDGDGELAWRS